MSIDSIGNSNLKPAAHLKNALDLHGHDENTMPVHSSNFFHALEMFSASTGDIALEKAARARIDTLRKKNCREPNINLEHNSDSLEMH